MTTPDHRFRPRIFNAARCRECWDTKDAPQHFGEHTRPIAPVPGFTCATVARLAERRGR